eukprot:365904-Alexandrium_andersonii.AAC.1
MLRSWPPALHRRAIAAAEDRHRASMEGALTSPPSGDGPERVEVPPGGGPGDHRLHQPGAADFGTVEAAEQDDEWAIAQLTKNASARVWLRRNGEPA